MFLKLNEERKIRWVSAIKSNLNDYTESTTIPITCATFLIQFSVSQARINLSYKMRCYSNAVFVMRFIHKRKTLKPQEQNICHGFKFIKRRIIFSCISFLYFLICS